MSCRDWIELCSLLLEDIFYLIWCTVINDFRRVNIYFVFLNNYLRKLLSDLMFCFKIMRGMMNCVQVIRKINEEDGFIIFVVCVYKFLQAVCFVKGPEDPSLCKLNYCWWMFSFFRLYRQTQVDLKQTNWQVLVWQAHREFYFQSF